MKLKRFVKEFVLFGVKQASAAIFGGYLLFIMILSHYWQPFDQLHRYDQIFIGAVLFQIFLLATKLENLREALVIIIFHFVATLMELFKTSDGIGSWSYPEDYYIGIAYVPLFTGFMYSAVGSYIARAWKIFQFKFSYYPSRKITYWLALAIYLNFFLHHYWYDLRWLLFSATFLVFYKTKIHFKVIKTPRQMPLLVGWLLVSLFIWLAENIATYVNIWVYPNQNDHWQMVSLGKLGSWFLLMIISFVLVSAIKPKQSLANPHEIN